MKLIVVSNPDATANEDEIVNSLFDEGLKLFHLRKPDYNKKDLITLLNKINSKHHSKIALHQHHTLTEQFEINRIHFTESERLKTTSDDLRKLKEECFTLSTSIHSLRDYQLLSDSFSYTFFGPVFESISKQGYKPQSDKMVPLAEIKDRKIKIIAIGGITVDMIEKTEQASFDGVALHGAIWSDTKNAIKTFNECCRSVNM